MVTLDAQWCFDCLGCNWFVNGGVKVLEEAKRHYHPRWHIVCRIDAGGRHDGGEYMKGLCEEPGPG